MTHTDGELFRMKVNAETSDDGKTWAAKTPTFPGLEGVGNSKGRAAIALLSAIQKHIEQEESANG